MDETNVLADCMIDEVNGDLDRALNVARCVRDSMTDLVSELERRADCSDT